jgi:hypothetical protein
MNTSLHDLMASSVTMDTSTALAHVGSQYLTAGLRLEDATSRILKFSVTAPGNGPSRVLVTLAGDDTYTVSALQWAADKDGLMDWRVVTQYTDVYCENLGDSLVSITKDAVVCK